tara:strand:+ start:135 stop:455 length:321 start_codon:yes stop_codon:yes gene_type:complete
MSIFNQEQEYRAPPKPKGVIPWNGRSIEEQKHFLKLRSRIYYAKPEIKKIQAERMRLYREKNRLKIRNKQVFKRIQKRMEKKLSLIFRRNKKLIEKLSILKVRTDL